MADESRERLFRDDGGAALERAARLEDENRHLRSEVERLRRGPRGTEAEATRSAMTAHSFIIGVATATTCLGIALVFLTDVRPHHHHSAPAHTVWQVPTSTPHFTAPPVAQDRAEEDCRVPYWIDASNRKHYKLACIK
jgi:hypothetical protein